MFSKYHLFEVIQLAERVDEDVYEAVADSIFPSKTERKNESTLFRIDSETEFYLKSPSPMRIIPTIGSDHDSIGISIRPTKSYGDPGCGPTSGILLNSIV